MNEIDKYLSSVYFDPKRSRGFGSVERLYRDVKYNPTPRQILEWLMSQDVFTLHKLVRRNFSRNRVLVSDLADMQSLKEYNDGYRYLLVCIDVFSKYAWVLPLKRKSGLALVEAFNSVISKETQKDPDRLGNGIFQQTFSNTDEQ